jgi:hypothetical protein
MWSVSGENSRVATSVRFMGHHRPSVILLSWFVCNSFLKANILNVCMYLLNSLDLSGRLAPLCQPLRLKKSDFNSRRITALYDNLTRSIDSKEKDSDSSSEPRGLRCAYLYFLSVVSHTYCTSHTYITYKLLLCTLLLYILIKT